jgi:hypothetical protein
VILDFFGVPAWAASAPHGCERGREAASARVISSEGLIAYRALIAEMLALGRREGVELRWWSPWNEPNDPRFLAPQRATCGVRGRALAPSAYAQLARAMAAELRASPGRHELLLGELGGYASGSTHRLSIGEFVAALPGDVICLSKTWAVHAYAVRGLRQAPPNPVAVLEAALEARGGCARSASIWVTEVGAGAVEPGRPRSGSAQEEGEDCLQEAEEVLAWYRDERVRAVFQYTFRDDPDFPVGLVNASLTRVYPVYRMWRAIASAPGDPPPAQVACSA